MPLGIPDDELPMQQKEAEKASTSYSPIESLREEVERFFDTNQLDPLRVTNFYAQARVVLRYVEELESELNDMCNHVRRIHSQSETAQRLLRRR
jgi:hypothetical protein